MYVYGDKKVSHDIITPNLLSMKAAVAPGLTVIPPSQPSFSNTATVVNCMPVGDSCIRKYAKLCSFYHDILCSTCFTCGQRTVICIPLLVCLYVWWLYVCVYVWGLYVCLYEWGLCVCVYV